MRTAYWKVDFKRCFFSRKMWGAIIGVCAVHFFVPQQITEEKISVFQSFNRAWGSNAMVLMYIFTALAYAQCFTEDMEQGYIRYAIIRGRSKNYAISKCVFVVLSAEFTMINGRMLFIFLLKCRYPWVSNVGELSLLTFFDGWRCWLDHGYYLRYLLLHSACQGIWAAILALFSAYISLYSSNRLFVLAFPAMVHHFIRRIVIALSGSNTMDPDHLFLINYNSMGNERLTLITIICVGILSLTLLLMIICKTVERIITDGKRKRNV